MKLNTEQQEIFLNKLNSFPHKLVCSVCGSNNWSANDTIFELREFMEGNLIIGGDQSLYPVIPITCNVCGNTHFLNPLKLGLLNQPENEVNK